MKSKQVFEIELVDIEDWAIRDIELKQFDEKVRELPICLDFSSGSLFWDKLGVL